MKMRAFEKRLVNNAGHSRHVGKQAARRLERLPIERGWSSLDVGCGNGVAALHVADRFGLEVTGIDVDPDQIRLATHASKGRPAWNRRMTPRTGTRATVRSS
jgi:ubiquinone/menaquinone biosynthesis C-methylase UbiE